MCICVYVCLVRVYLRVRLFIACVQVDCTLYKQVWCDDVMPREYGAALPSVAAAHWNNKKAGGVRLWTATVPDVDPELRVCVCVCVRTLDRPMDVLREEEQRERKRCRIHNNNK